MYSFVQNLFVTRYQDEIEAMGEGHYVEEYLKPYYRLVKNPITIDENAFPNSAWYQYLNETKQKALNAGKTEYELFEFIGDVDTIPVSVVEKLLGDDYPYDLSEIMTEGFEEERRLRKITKDLKGEERI